MLHNNFNKILKLFQNFYNKDKYIYNFCNLQNNIFEEEYYYNIGLNTKYMHNLECFHKFFMDKIMNYFILFLKDPQ